MYVGGATKIFLEQSFIAQATITQNNGHDDKLLAIRHDTPLLFPISSKRDVSRRISINRRRRTMKRKGERGASEKIRAGCIHCRDCTCTAFVNTAHLYAIAQGKRR